MTTDGATREPGVVRSPGESSPIRQDWRWLLPSRTYPRALSLAGGALRASLESLVPEVIARLDERPDERPEGGAGRYDLVVASSTAPAVLRAAHRALSPTGVLYAETAEAMSPSGLARRLAEAGFADARLVLPWPNRSDTRAWLPVGASSRAARYFLTRHPIAARHPARRFLHLMTRRAALMRLTLDRPHHLSVVARPRAHDGVAGAAPVPWWLDRARESTGAWHDWLLVTHARAVESRAVGFTLRRNETLPVAAVKLARTESSRVRLAHAAEVLQQLASAGFAAGGRSPRPLGTVTDGAGAVITSVEEAVHGLWLDAAIRRDVLPRTMIEVTEWLLLLAHATRAPSSFDGALPAQRFRPALSAFRARVDGVIDPGLLHEVEALLGAAAPMPCVVEHHDFRPWNIYRTTRGGLTAFDWDGAHPRGVPALDLLHCQAYLHFTLAGTMRTREFATAYEESERGALGILRQRCVRRYAEALGIGESALRAIRAFAWMELATEEVDEYRAAGRPPARRSLLGLWESEARRALA